MDETKVYDTDEFIDENISETLKEIVLNLEDRGYNPINQIVGYLMSGDPGYISNHKESRNKILKFDRRETMIGIASFYLLLYNVSYNMVRQSISIAFIILAFSLYITSTKKKEKLMSFLCFVIAYEFHSTFILI